MLYFIDTLLNRAKRASHNGDCACWQNWFKLSRVRNNCKADYTPYPRKSVFGCSCYCVSNKRAEKIVGFVNDAKNTVKSWFG